MESLGVPVPAEVIFGEAGICGLQAMIAVAWIYSRNPKMNGWHDSPSATAKWISRVWYKLPDYSNGGYYIFSLDDLKRERVKHLATTLREKARFKCRKGLGLVVYDNNF